MDREREPEAGAGEDHGTHHEMVGERRVDAAERVDDVANRGDVRLQVRVELGVGQLGKRLHAEALVAVGDEDRQQPADLRHVGDH